MEDKKQTLTKEVEDLKQALTLQELEFCDLVIRGVLPVNAVEKAGLSPTPDKKIADRLMESFVIQEYIDALQRQVAVRSVMTLEKIDQRLSDIAMTDTTDVVEVGDVFTPIDADGCQGEPIQIVTIKDIDKLTEAQRAAIAQIKPCKGGLEIKLHDKVKVMELLAKRRGGFVEKQEVSHAGNVQIYTMVGDNGRGPKQ